LGRKRKDFLWNLELGDHASRWKQGLNFVKFAGSKENSDFVVQATDGAYVNGYVVARDQINNLHKQRSIFRTFWLVLCEHLHCSGIVIENA
jgi:hypothetical protein